MGGGGGISQDGKITEVKKEKLKKSETEKMIKELDKFIKDKTEKDLIPKE